MSDHDEVKAAAERLVSRCDLTCGEISCEDCNDDREAGVRIARAYLAHPPLTRERVAAAVGELFDAYRNGTNSPVFFEDGMVDDLCRLLGVSDQ